MAIFIGVGKQCGLKVYEEVICEDELRQNDLNDKLNTRKKEYAWNACSVMSESAKKKRI